MRQQIRKEARVPLREMAASLNVAPMTLQRWERGVATPRLDHAVSYRRLLDELEAALNERALDA
jgi:DNA-binding transcriptional regulator YiaG